MKLREIMTKNVEVLHSEDTILTAAQKMRDRDVGFLPVLEGGELIGVITDRDLVIRILADGINSKARIGRDILTSPAIYCFEDQDVDSAMQLMKMHQIRRVVVLDHNNGSIVGVISLGDLATYMPPDTAGEIFREISNGFVTAR
jgi:CBS domain-containing protein